MTKTRLRILVGLLVVALMLPAVGSSAASWIQCPAGQVPNWDNTSCMTPQPVFTLSGYAAPTQQNAVPQGGLNGAPAMQRCNGIAVPMSVPCSAASPSVITQSIPATIAESNAATAAAASAASAKPPSIIISVPGGSYAEATGIGVDATAQLQSLLGDWYTGWLQYLAAAFNFSPDNLQQISLTFTRLPSCVSGQASACESSIWQQISQWVGAAPIGS